MKLQMHTLIYLQIMQYLIFILKKKNNGAFCSIDLIENNVEVELKMI